MDLREVLAQVPGLHRRFVYYLEARGFISPRKVPKERIARRDYSPQDLEVIRHTWKYYQRGYSLQRAYELATNPQRVVAYVAFQVPRGGLPRALEGLRRHPEVAEASAIYGARLDLLLRLETSHESDIYHTLVPFLAETGIGGLPEISLAKEGFRRPSQGGGMKAYVLMKVPGKDVDAVMEELRALPAVKEASTVYGESDIIAKVEVANQEELDDLVMGRIHGIPAVESTRTFIVIGRLHWSR